MKLKNIFMLIALTLGAFAFVACGDDESNDPKKQDNTTEINEEVVGTYTGWSHLTTNYLDKNYAANTLTLALAEDGTLTATYVNGTWGTATITGIKASEIASGEGYKLEEGEGSFIMNNPRDNTTQEFPCRLDHALISADKKQVLVVIIANMTVSGGHGDMVFTFQTGEVPTEE